MNSVVLPTGRHEYLVVHHIRTRRGHERHALFDVTDGVFSLLRCRVFAAATLSPRRKEGRCRSAEVLSKLERVGAGGDRTPSFRRTTSSDDDYAGDRILLLLLLSFPELDDLGR